MFADGSCQIVATNRFVTTMDCYRSSPRYVPSIWVARTEKNARAL